MLGFAPIAAVPIAGGGFALLQYYEPATATASFTFAGSGDLAYLIPASARANISFGSSAVWNTLNDIAATSSFSFSASGEITVAGRPIVISAMADSYAVRVDKYSYHSTAVPESLTMRGVPE